MMRVPASGAVIGEREKELMHAAVDRGWLTASTQNARFEDALAEFTGIRHVRTCNSGSSANLLAVAAMVESGRWKRGDRIVTVAACFPTTINPLLMFGLVPVFVDITLPTYQVNVAQMERAIREHKASGIMLAHTLGNPFDIPAVYEIAGRHRLRVIEDCCDALGATFLESIAGMSVGMFSHVGRHASAATCSFFPAHHITTGEGGAVFTQDPLIARHIESVRDWGRDCWCAPGDSNSCGKRFAQQHGDLPYGYDHKYTFSRLGFNLKLTEISAACGLAQIERLPDFVAARRRSFAYLRERLSGIGSTIVLPEATADSSPSWFGFPITLKEEGLRAPLQQYLAERGIDSRPLFAGNIVRQPYMKGRPMVVASDLRVTDQVAENSFWIGLHPALDEEQLSYAAETIATFLGDF